LHTRVEEAWFGHDLLLDHVLHELVWYLLEDLLGQHAEIACFLKVLKLDELDDVADCRLAAGIPDSYFVAVQLLHV
jgi:hypothetical protein